MQLLEGRKHGDAHSFDLLRWYREFRDLLNRRFRAQGRVMGAAFVVGLVAGIGAVLFSGACHLVSHFALDAVIGYRPAAPAGEAELPWLHATTRVFEPWWFLVIPPLGGFLSGWMVFRFAPEAEGHGTDAAVASYHFHRGEIRSRVPFVKMVSSALTIGSGGSGGREGPIAQIGAGFGSLLGKVLHLKPAERRVLVAAGIGAGVAAIFRAPLAGALFSAEVLYRSPEMEQEVLIPAGISSVVSYCTFGVFFGWAPLFAAPRLSFGNPLELATYVVLAVAMSILALFYTRTLAGFTSLFGRLRLPRVFKPAIGAFLTGALGLAMFYLFGEDQLVLSVLSFGYAVLQRGITDLESVPILVLLAVAVGKIFTTSLTIGSGGSGGVFGPSMVIGGCAGGALGLAFHRLWPGVVQHPESYLIVGMAGFFAAAAKTPFSTLAIVCEMTGDYGLLLPALWVCTISFLVSDQMSLYGWQVESRSRSPAHQGAYVRDVLSGLRVADFVRSTSEIPTLRPHDSLPKFIDEYGTSDHHVFPVLSDEKRLLGVVVLDEIHQSFEAPYLAALLLVEDAMRAEVQPLYPSMTIDRALELFAEQDLPALPVVASADSRVVIGIVRRREIMSEYVRRLHGPSAVENVPLSVA